MASKLDETGFKSSVADPDVRMKSAIKDDGSEVYGYCLSYVDDILCTDMDPNLEGGTIRYKNDIIEPPSSYLGAKFQEK